MNIWKRLIGILLLMISCGCDSTNKPIPATFPPLTAATPGLQASETTAGPAVTPAATRPASNDDESWTPAKADQLINNLLNYPETLRIPWRGLHDHNYYFSFMFAGLAQAEAIYRFQPAIGSEWHWSRARILAGAASPQAPTAYGDLIVAALNSRETTVAALPQWFAGHETLLKLDIEPLTTNLSLNNSHIVKLNLALNTAYFWLVEDENGYAAHPLDTDYAYGLAHYANSWHQIADLTGDGNAELIISQSRQYGSEATARMVVYDLTTVPPKPLLWDPVFPYPGIWPEWDVVMDEFGHNQIRFTELLDRYLCGTQIFRTYGWSGEQVTLVHWEYPTSTEILADLEIVDGFDYCTDLLLSHIHYNARLGQPDAIERLAQLLPVFPLYPNEAYQQPYPPDAQDELQFELALFYANAGQDDAARRQLTQLAETPTYPGTIWQQQASQFLAAYEPASDFLAACAATGLCNAHFVETSFFRFLTPDDLPDIGARLREMGLPLTASGQFAGTTTIDPFAWVMLEKTYRYGTGTEVYIFYAANNRVNYQYVGSFDGVVTSAELLHTGGVTRLHTFVLESDSENIPFSYELKPGDPLPRILNEYYQGRYSWENLQILEGTLFSSADPTVVIPDLELYLADQVDDVNAAELEFQRYHSVLYARYLLGLAYEFSGDLEKATEQFAIVWQASVRSPLSDMAYVRLKHLP
ncbi:MAG: hypothetical protein KDE09_22280 [Anaerolineales bacterium]|nr:hypothetical protein [Anaerolineales bacterium]